MNAYENLMPVLEECINGQPIKMLDILSMNKQKIYLYASCPAVRLLEEIMQNSFKFFNNEINHFRSDGSSNILTEKALENFQNNAHLIILLFAKLNMILPILFLAR